MDKYTWQEVGSSFLPGELIAAFLWAQLDEAERITEERLACWELYHQLLEPLEKEGLLRRPVVPADCQHNAHMYYVLLDSAASREQLLDDLKRQGIGAVFHYVPLHASPAGERYGRVHDSMAVTERQSERLVRLPLWLGISEAEQNQVVEQIKISLKCSG